MIVGTALAQEDIPEAQIFLSGKQKYEELDFQGCIDEMTKLIGQVNSKLEASQDLSEETRSYYMNALEYRALANINMADDQAASEDFRSLIRFNPQYQLNEELASPLIRQLFQGIRDELVGYLTVYSEPDKATIEVDGSDVGQTNAEQIPIVVGPHAVEVILKGYTTAQLEVNIEAGKTKTESVELQRNTAIIYVVSSPSGAEVLLDGEVIGTTYGTAGEDFADEAAKHGLPVESLSEKFQIPYVELGDRSIVLRKECFQTSALNKVSVSSPLDYADTPVVVVLKASQGTLELNGVPADAQVFLNGQEQEKGQASFPNICAQKYEIVVRNQAGSFKTSETIFRDQTTKVDVQLRPALVYLGAEFRGELDEDLQPAANRTLSGLFDGRTGFRVIPPGDESIKAALKDANLGLDSFAGLVNADSFAQTSKQLYPAVRRVCRGLDANLLAVAVFQERKIGSKFRVFVFSSQCTYPDSILVDIDDPAKIEQAVKRLDYKFSFEKSWLGITAVDTRMRGGTAVISVQPGSPAAQAGIEVGSFITAVEGQKITGHREVIEILRQKKPGETLILDLDKSGDISQKSVTLGRSPLLLPLYSQSFSYNTAIAHLALSASLDKDGQAEQLALFNIGLVQAHFGAWEEAIVYLRRVKLGSNPGINQGTVEYYLGLSYEKLGYKTEAVDHFKKALEYESASLDSNDGPPIAPEVRHKLKQLGEGS